MLVPSFACPQVEMGPEDAGSHEPKDHDSHGERSEHAVAKAVEVLQELPKNTPET